MKGKEKCRILKQLRQEIAEKNDIEWTISECTHQGDCKGTCPKCEAEVRKLERELDIRRKIGKAVAIVGISSICAVGLAACSPSDLLSRLPSSCVPERPTEEELAGMIDMVPTEEETIELDGEIASEPPEEESIELSGDVAYEETQGLPNVEFGRVIPGKKH